MVQLIACEGCGHGVYSNESQCAKCRTPVRPEWVARQKHEIDLESESPVDITPPSAPASALMWSRVTTFIIGLIVIAAITGGVLLVR